MAGEWIYDMPEADYFGDTSRLSNSRIGDWIADRRTFHQPELRPPATDSMKFGSYFDTCITRSPEEARDAYVVAPSRRDVGDTRDPSKLNMLLDRSKNRKEWAEFKDGLNGREWVRPEHVSVAVAMVEAIRDHHDDVCKAGELLWPSAVGRNQVVGHWLDAVTCEPMRCRIDRLPPGLDPVHDLPVIVDLKSTADASPSAWAKSFYKYGYHRQGWTYLSAFKAITGSDAVIAWLVVERPEDPRLRPRVAVRWNKIDDPAIQIGRAQCRRAMREIAEARRSGDYREEWERTTSTGVVPGWVAREHEFNTDATGVLRGVEKAS